MFWRPLIFWGTWGHTASCQLLGAGHFLGAQAVLGGDVCTVVPQGTLLEGVCVWSLTSFRGLMACFPEHCQAGGLRARLGPARCPEPLLETGPMPPLRPPLSFHSPWFPAPSEGPLCRVSLAGSVLAPKVHLRTPQTFSPRALTLRKVDLAEEGLRTWSVIPSSCPCAGCALVVFESYP